MANVQAQFCLLAASGLSAAPGMTEAHPSAVVRGLFWQPARRLVLAALFPREQYRDTSAPEFVAEGRRDLDPPSIQ